VRRPSGPGRRRGERDILRIQENREKNLQVAQGLQEDLEAQVDKLLNGTLTVTRQTATGQTIEVPVGLKERLELVNYARTVAELPYRALGDGAPSRPNEPPGGQAHGTSVTVILPEAVSAPRSAREGGPNSPGAVIDIGPPPASFSTAG
jgi:hypothetical protein